MAWSLFRSSPRTPRAAARGELVRAVLGLLRGACALPGFWIEREGLCAQVLSDVRGGTRAPDPVPSALPRREVTVFLSVAEASGEAHAVAFVKALKRRLAEAGAPAPRLLGLGGPALEAEGVRCLADPTSRATMDAGEAARGLGYYEDLLEQVARALDQEAALVFVAVDSPALHVPMASLAKDRGVPSVHFIAPQYWAWAPWRQHRYARVFDLGLTILPFEPRWFARTRIHTQHVGHPIVDSLPKVPAQGDPARMALALLPGSRDKEIEDNLPWMLERVAALRDRGELDRETPIRVLQSSPRSAERIRALVEQGPVPAELVVGPLHEGLATARTAVAVSGTVLLEVAHHRVPTVVLYRVTGGWKPWLRGLLTAPWISKPNLLAGEEVLPEFAFAGEGEPARFEATLARLHGDPDARRGVARALDRAFLRLGPRGAADRAAGHVLGLLADREESGQDRMNAAQGPA